MLGKREKHRALLLLTLVFGLYSTFDQWTRILQPFLQWQLEPRADLAGIMHLNAIGNGCILIGTFLVAHLIDSIGCRRAAFIVTIVSSIYQMAISRIGTYTGFMCAQLLLLVGGNQFPMIADAFVAVVVGGADGDQRERMRLLMRLTVPTSVAVVAGPYLAIQVLYTVPNASVHVSQFMCGALAAIVLLPAIYYLLPEPAESKYENTRLRTIPLLQTYVDLLRDGNLRRSLLIYILVSGPYSAYDQITRTQMAAYLISNPWNMCYLVALLGATTFVTNLLVVERLQRRLSPQRLLQLSLVILVVSYLYLAQNAGTSSFFHIIVGMPIQVVGICLASGELTAQVMSSASKSDVGKAAGLNRAAFLLSTLMTPLLTGYYIDGSETNLLCYASAGISLVALVLVHFFGGYMNANVINRLPTRAHVD